MKNTIILSVKKILALTCAIGAFGAVAHADIVFSNLNQPSGLFNSGASTNGGTAQIGDEVILAGGQSGIVTNFSFEFYGSNFVGSAQSARVLFYANDGSASPAGPLNPQSILWDSGTFTIPDTFNPTYGTNCLVSFDLGAGVSVPGDFTWSVVFSGIGTSESAGLVFSTGAPTVGSGYNDYWVNTGTVISPSWSLQVNPSYSVDFLAQISTVPEPSTGLMLFSGLGVFAVIQWARRSSGKKY